MDTLCPLPHVFPLPDPIPLPTRFFFFLAPGLSEIVLSFKGSVGTRGGGEGAGDPAPAPAAAEVGVRPTPPEKHLNCVLTFDTVAVQSRASTLRTGAIAAILCFSLRSSFFFSLDYSIFYIRRSLDTPHYAHFPYDSPFSIGRKRKSLIERGRKKIETDRNRKKKVKENR